MTEHSTDILIVGGGPGGIMTGMTSAQISPDKRITLVRPETKVLVPCGIPYIFGTLGGTDEDLIGELPFLQAGGELLVDRVESVDREARTATLAGGDRIRWERLVIATGSRAFMPPIPGADLEGVHTIHKDYDYMDRFFREVVAGVKRIVVVGGGFIGVEFADEIAKRGIEVHLVEHHPHVLSRSFDRDACLQVQAHLLDAGLQLHTSVRVQALEAGPDGAQVGGVRLVGGERIETDAVLIAAGTRPNIDLAKAMGLAISDKGAILVDAFQRTREDPEIFAVGDCASKQDFFTRRPANALLASQAAAEGRIAGMSLYALHAPRFNAGSISVYASQVGDLAFGVAGLTEAQAGELGFQVYRGESRMPDHHPSTLPGTHEVYCRLIFAQLGGRLLGGQVIGGPTSGEILNAIGIAIQMRASAADLASFQFGSQPLLTASIHPIVGAAVNALANHFQNARPAMGKKEG
jgi:NADH oxidase (H2O2-forming)